MDRGLMAPDGNPLKIVRSASNHLVLVDGEVILVCENHFQRLFVLKDFSEFTLQATVQLLKNYLKMPYPLKQGNRIESHQINNLPAAEGPLAEHLIDARFEKDGARLVLWSEV